jgi:RNA polymerase sigma-70 factor (ECF subfamily)
MPDEPSGDRDFSTLYRATLAPLRRYLTRLLGNSSEAQDVAHDAYMRVYPSLADKSARRPAALLYTAARRLAINRLKRRSISPVARRRSPSCPRAAATCFYCARLNSCPTARSPTGFPSP